MPAWSRAAIRLASNVSSNRIPGFAVGSSPRVPPVTLEVSQASENMKSHGRPEHGDGLLPTARSQSIHFHGEVISALEGVRLARDAGIISDEELVTRELTVQVKDRRNHNLLVHKVDGTGFFIKQARIPDAVSTIQNEADVLSAIWESEINELKAHVPRILHYDKAKSVMVTEFVPGQSLGSRSAGLSGIGDAQMACIGRAISRVHSTPPLRIAHNGWIPFALALYRPSLHVHRHSSIGNIQLLNALQRSEILC
jgi:hypothetical protein